MDKVAAGQNSSPITASGAPEEAERGSIRRIWEVWGTVSTTDAPPEAARQTCMTNRCAHFLPNKGTIEYTQMNARLTNLHKPV